jgi:hypothetical protein
MISVSVASATISKDETIIGSLQDLVCDERINPVRSVFKIHARRAIIKGLSIDDIFCMNGAFDISLEGVKLTECYVEASTSTVEMNGVIILENAHIVQAASEESQKINRKTLIMTEKIKSIVDKYVLEK